MQSNSNPQKQSTRKSTLISVLSIVVVIVLFMFIWNRFISPDPGFDVNTSDDRDMLSYLTNDGQLRLYDPLTRTQTILIENVYSYVLSRDDRVAFTRLPEEDTDIYVYDLATPSIAPINITQNPEIRHQPLSWHPDGHYLLFRSYLMSEYGEGFGPEIIEQTYFIWDGTDVQRIEQNYAYVDEIYSINIGSGETVEVEIVRQAFSENMAPVTSWYENGEELIERSAYSAGGDRMIGLTDNTRISFSFTLASGLPSANLVARNADGNRLFSAHVGSVAWSRDGYLAFCRVSGRDWVLSLWNGRRSWAIASTWYQPIQWQNGDRSFSCNNG